jgi:poly(A) polymerase
MSESSRLPDLSAAEWLNRPQTRRVLAALEAGGAQARAVGGAVRNALMGTPVKDIDIATTAVPQEVVRLAKKAGLHSVPTGIEHGTVTVIADHVPFEVTTLRRDIETFGRHARVTFTTDWREDALRRDFTMNALYCGADGHVHDPLGGYGDIIARRVRFIGEARERIREDYLRILRFFRFIAEYGDGSAPDPEGLAASIAEKEGLRGLSGERIRAELLRLLAAPGAVAAARALTGAKLAEPMLGMDADAERLSRLAAIELALGHPADAVFRLGAYAAPGLAEAARLQSRLRLSSAEAARIMQAASGAEAFDPAAGEAAAKAFIYRNGADAFRDGALIAWATSGDRPDDASRKAHVGIADRWTAPAPPARGADVIARGVRAGPAIGRIIGELERWWIAAGYPGDKSLIAQKLDELVRNERRDGEKS